jgi:DNA excision repair protein ERCC-3
LEIIKESDVTIVSRVGDEGMSIPDIERVIEFDFLFGSRRQEGQRMGRLFHGTGKGEHIILMTENEYEDHSKRLYAITEKGFRIEVVR